MNKPWKPTTRIWSEKEHAFVNVTVEISIDWNDIAARLARNALRNKSGKAGLLSGSIKAKIVRPK